jgi:hypothetical protein
MLLLYCLLLGLLAALTAYTRNFQSTLIALGQQIAAAGAVPTPGWQTLRTIALVLAWPAAMGFGMLFVAWWKAAALVVAAFLLLVPVIGSFLPRPMSGHYVDQIRSDLEQRVARGGPDAAQLRRILAQLDALSRRGPHQGPA